jgi:ribosomal protein S18 acetylase RimI-like enzyme
MAATWTLAAMTMTDYDQVIRLLAGCEGVGQTASDERPDMERFLERNPGLSQVAIADGHLVGTALCGHDARRGMIYHLAVHPRHRRQGVATALVDACLGGLTRLGVRKCNIVVYENNPAGRAFWDAGGWTWRSDLVFLQRTLL